jgi:glycosyltransferase involved in cell wall biosynthesis
MKIGIMLRHLDQHGGGVRTYTLSLLDKLLSLNSPHKFVLIYNNCRHIGKYARYNNVREVAINTPSRVLWDQIGIPWLQRKERMDLIFNPKYSLPFFIDCPTVFVCHGLNSYVMQWGSKPAAVLYRQYIYPRYAIKASSIIAVSDTARTQLKDFLDLEEEKVHTVYHGVDDIYRQTIGENELRNTKSQYSLPERFFLFAGQIFPLKNFGRLLYAYSKVGPELGIHLVVAGEHRWLCEPELKLIDKLGISKWVRRSGWVEAKTLRCFFKLTIALVFPSLYETFGLPIIEAMASGCPVITSNRFGTKEIGGNAVMLVDPENVDSIAQGMRRVATDKELRDEMVQEGYKRERQFSWEKCAEETLRVLERAATLPRAKGSSAKVFRLKEGHKALTIKRPPRLLHNGMQF